MPEGCSNTVTNSLSTIGPESCSKTGTNSLPTIGPESCIKHGYKQSVNYWTRKLHQTRVHSTCRGRKKTQVMPINKNAHTCAQQVQSGYTFNTILSHREARPLKVHWGCTHCKVIANSTLPLGEHQMNACILGLQALQGHGQFHSLSR